MYPFPHLDEATAGASPWPLFERWYREALQAQLHEPSAMTVATATPEGVPSARVVLLRGFDERGFVFFTNYQSRKGAELAANPRAALAIYWGPLERQVRAEGLVVKVAPQESDDYFRSRPLGHRLGALVSAQSVVIPNRQHLEQRMAELVGLYEGKEVPRPEHWGGYRIVPNAIEFWQGQLNRLHDRLRYRRGDEGDWLLERLAP